MHRGWSPATGVLSAVILVLPTGSRRDVDYSFTVIVPHPVAPHQLPTISHVCHTAACSRVVLFLCLIDDNEQRNT